jgi:hypothetical protein
VYPLSLKEFVFAVMTRSILMSLKIFATQPGSFASASCFCRAFDEGRQFFRVRTTMKQKISLVQQREMFPHRLDAFVGPGAGSVTHMYGGAGVSSNIILAFVLSVLTHPVKVQEQDKEQKNEQARTRGVTGRTR